MTTYSSIYLGTDCDPKPCFKDEAPDAFDWPEDAVMAVTFERERFGHMAEEIVRELPRTDFYGADGWPLPLPEARKRELSDLMKAEFQAQPWGWRTWTVADWDRARTAPRAFRLARRHTGLARHLARTTAPLAAETT